MEISSRFNEAAVYSPRKRGSGEIRVRPDHASMRPRCIHRGNCRFAEVRRGRPVSFNEAAVYSPRKLRTRRRITQTGACFNEAAVYSPRKPIRLSTNGKTESLLQ